MQSSNRTVAASTQLGYRANGQLLRHEIMRHDLIAEPGAGL